MKFALSTNWCNRRLVRGEEIAEAALALGFDELELGFRTTPESVAGFKAMLGRIPVRSIHAFCPVPLSAPAGHPELFQLASFAAGERDLARAHVVRNIRFAAEIGADTVVLHAGRVAFSTLFSFRDSSLLREAFEKGGGKVDARGYRRLLARARKTRKARGQRLMPLFRQTLEEIVPVLKECGVTLAFENLPYLEGFPDEDETAALVQEFGEAGVRGWFDTGHHRVREQLGWLAGVAAPLPVESYAGMHLNDVVDVHDDHFAPGDGKVDFASLKPMAQAVRHVVFEPNGEVGEEALRRGLEHIRALWDGPDAKNGEEAPLPSQVKI